VEAHHGLYSKSCGHDIPNDIARSFGSYHMRLDQAEGLV
jgi:hypothetical protein